MATLNRTFGLQAILDKIRKGDDGIFWQLWESEPGAQEKGFITEYRSTNKNSSEQSANELEAELAKYEPGQFYVKLFRTPVGERSGAGNTVKCPTFILHAGMSSNTITGTGTGDKTIIKELREVRNELEAEREKNRQLAEAERDRKWEERFNKIEGLLESREDEKEEEPEPLSGWDKLADKIAGIIEQNNLAIPLANKYLGLNLPVGSGAPVRLADNVSTATPEQQTAADETVRARVAMESCKESCIIILQVDGAFPERLKKMAAWAACGIPGEGYNEAEFKKYQMFCSYI